MPVNLVDRLPLPSLHTYVSLSVLVLALSVFYAHQTVNTKLAMDPELLPIELVNVTLPYNDEDHVWNIFHVMTIETWCIWSLVNTCYCLLILLGKLIQTIVFGDIRISEQQHLKDKFWNFVFYKFIFIFGVMNVQSMDQVVWWVAWFSALGFLHLLTQLSRDRFEYLSFSPATTRSAHVKLLSLLVFIQFSCGLLFLACAWVGMNVSMTIFFFLVAESLLLMLKCIHVIQRYAIQLYDMTQDGVWEARAIYVYYTELVFELVDISLDFVHHIHMLLYGNIFQPCMACLVICMQLRYLFYEFQRRIRRHKNYRRVVNDMEAMFPMATQEDLEKNADDCAICWEQMESARKLSCGHLFHNSCLRSWLEQDTSCPTCRTSLGNSQEESTRVPQPVLPNDGMVAPANQGTTNHFFHFDGSRYVSWLPSFSVEVTHTNILPGHRHHATQTSQLDNMAREVQVVFPNIPQSVIMEDLRVTRSVDLTIDNILEGRVTIPPVVTLGHQRTGSNVSNSSEPSVAQPLPAPTPVVDQQETPVASVVSTSSCPPTTESHPATRERLHSEQITNILAAGDSVPDDSTVLYPINTGGRFSKSASERMTMLSQRKEAMLQVARRRYLAQEQVSTAVSDGESSKESSAIGSKTAELDEQSQRRAVLLQATERRLERLERLEND